ncbi:MAG: type II toxin-antitoxin system RelB/DinJ family antitoxin [Coriobacteriales bacterium]|nr:type II toxin-antitoxin system RelB/DinJ family antitoxin [Coriobacteriales bacterium]
MTTTVSFRIDVEVKRAFDEFCQKVGMSASTAYNLFARAVTREQRLPFAVTTNEEPFWSEANQERLYRSYEQLKSGNGAQHDLIEA